METEQNLLARKKAGEYAQELLSSSYDLIGVDVESEYGEDIDILLLGFGDQPIVRIENYVPGSFDAEVELSHPDEDELSDLLPEEERWSYRVSDIRTGIANRDSEPVEWDWCYADFDPGQFKSFSRSFLGYGPDQWADDIWRSWDQEYF